MDKTEDKKATEDKSRRSLFESDYVALYILITAFAVFFHKQGLVIPPGDAITKPKREEERAY